MNSKICQFVTQFFNVNRFRDLSSRLSARFSTLLMLAGVRALHASLHGWPLARYQSNGLILPVLLVRPETIACWADLSFTADVFHSVGQKHAKFGAISGDFEVRLRIPLKRMKIFKIGLGRFAPRFLSRWVMKVEW